METRTRHQFPVAFVASLLGHALLVLLVFGPLAAPELTTHSDRRSSEAVDIELDSNFQQMVESERGGEQSVVEDTRFHGERNQQVEEQTRARLLGKFRAGNGETGTSLAPSNGDGNEGGLEGLSMKDLGIGAVTTPDAEVSEGVGMSATDDRLDGIRTGVRTLLTTRESKYFAFYQRAKRQLKAKWEVELASRVVTHEARVKASQRSRWSTRIVATLDGEGRVVDASVTRTSGSTVMDEAARQAFFAVAIFHNPPKGMFREDGQLFLPWEFNVQMTPSALAFAGSDDAEDRFRRME